MSELKSFIVLYGGKFIRAYKESEADKVIAHHKYKRCLAIADKCEAWIRLDVSPRHTNRFIRWYKIWLELADKFKETK